MKSETEMALNYLMRWGLENNPSHPDYYRTFAQTVRIMNAAKERRLCLFGNFAPDSEQPNTKEDKK